MPRTILGTEAQPLYCVTRAEWQARPPKFVTTFPAANKPAAVNYEHHTVTSFLDAGGTGPEAWAAVVAMILSGNEPADALMRSIQNFHMDSRGWSDIAYSWLVDNDGVAYEGRGWNRTGGHTAGQNTVSFAICHIGDYSTLKASGASLDTAAALWYEGIALGAVSPTFTLKGHRQAPGASTTCPGNALFAQLADLRSRVGHIAFQEDDELTDIEKVQLRLTFEAVGRLEASVRTPAFGIEDRVKDIQATVDELLSNLPEP